MTRSSLVLAMLLLPLVIHAQSALEPPEVVDIRFEGNTALTSANLLRQITINPKTLLRRGSLYNVHHVDRENRNLTNYYRQYGFLDAVITDSLIVHSDLEVELLFRVKEGKRYYLNAVEIVGNRVIDDATYLENIDVQRGAPFNVFEIRSELRRVLRQYEETGYPLVMISDSAAVGDSVSLTIQVREGPRLRIGEIAIPAVDQIPEPIIRRELIVKPGEWFNIARIEESKRRLFETSLFSSVNITTTHIDTTAGLLDLQVETLPAKFKAFDLDFGAGQAREFGNADPVVSIGGKGSWYHNNWLESSRRLRVQTEVSSLYPDIFIPQTFKLDLFYVEPWIFGLRLPLTVNPFYDYLTEAQGDFRSEGGGIRLYTSYRWFRRVRVLSTLEWSTVREEGQALGTETGYQEQRVFESSFVLDERDHYFSPHKGYRLTLKPRMVGYFLGGESEYWQVEGAFSTYWGIGRHLVLAQNLNLAVGGGADSTTAIPTTDRFYLGGNSSLRGYAYQGVGPMAADGETPLGGQFRFFANLELRFPIYSYFGGEVFYDVGYLWATPQDVDWSELASNIGLGLTIDTPIGPARIDYGIPLVEGGLSQGGELHIAITYAF